MTNLSCKIPYRNGLAQHRQAVAWVEILLELQRIIRKSPASRRRSQIRTEYRRRTRTRTRSRR